MITRNCITHDEVQLSNMFKIFYQHIVLLSELFVMPFLPLLYFTTYCFVIDTTIYFIIHSILYCAREQIHFLIWLASSEINGLFIHPKHYTVLFPTISKAPLCTVCLWTGIPWWVILPKANLLCLLVFGVSCHSDDALFLLTGWSQCRRFLTPSVALLPL